MKVIVTGGLGFIGSEVANAFRASGHVVLVVDSTESNIFDAHEARRRGIEVSEISVRAYLDACHSSIEADLVVHAASPVGAAAILRSPHGIADEMVSSTAALGRACLASSTPMVFISSSEVYGLNGSLSEDMRPRIPITFSARVEYALGKLTSEAVLAGLGRRGLTFVCIRPFNVVGARQSRFGGFVLPTFVQQSLAGLPITVFEDGTQTRSFLGVADLADFIVNHCTDELLQQRTCINVGNPANSCSILNLAMRTKFLLDSPSEIQFIEGSEIYGPGYVEAASRQKLCLIAKAREQGWSPRQSLDELIQEAGHYYRNHRDKRNCDARDR